MVKLKAKQFGIPQTLEAFLIDGTEETRVKILEWLGDSDTFKDVLITHKGIYIVKDIKGNLGLFAQDSIKANYKEVT